MGTFPTNTDGRVAVMVDCDNTSPEILEHALQVVAQFGRVVLRRGYGNHSTLANRWQEALVRLAFTPCLQYQYAAGKNTADIALALDAVEAMFDGRADTFCLVTSDSDFTPLVMKLLAKGKQVIGFGESKTPEPFKRACSVFIHTDDFREPTEENPKPQNQKRKDRNQLRGDTELMNALREAIASTKDEDGWSSMQRIGGYISNHSSLSFKNYGYPRWTDLVRATEYFDMEARDSNHSFFREKTSTKG